MCTHFTCTLSNFAVQFEITRAAMNEWPHASDVREKLALLALELKLTMSDSRDVQYTDICTMRVPFGHSAFRRPERTRLYFSNSRRPGLATKSEFLLSAVLILRPNIDARLAGLEIRIQNSEQSPPRPDLRMRTATTRTRIIISMYIRSFSRRPPYQSGPGGSSGR